MATGKRELIVAQAGLVWMDDKFDAEWYVETGKVVTPDWSEFKPMLEQAKALALEGKAAWLIEKTSKQAKPT